MQGFRLPDKVVRARLKELGAARDITALFRLVRRFNRENIGRERKCS